MAQHLFTPTDNTHHRQSRFTVWLNEMFTELYTAWATMLASIGTNTSDISTLESTVGGHTTSISTLEGAYSANVNHTDIGGTSLSRGREQDWPGSFFIFTREIKNYVILVISTMLELRQKREMHRPH